MAESIRQRPFGFPRVPAGAGAFSRRVFGSRLAQIGAVILGIHLAVALAGIVWNPDATRLVGTIRADPSWVHPFGTDHLGRDVFARVVSGSAALIGVSAAAAITSVALGATIGALVSYRGGWLDQIVMRGVDIMLSFPIILVALLGASLLPSGYLSLYIVVSAVLAWPAIRVARAVFADVLSRDYITAAVLRGESVASVVTREALPNATGPLLVEFALRWNFAVILIASLSFLGVGVQPPTPDWGLMLFEARNELLITPWVAIAPALALASLAIAINFVADGLAAAFAQRTSVARADR